MVAAMSGEDIAAEIAAALREVGEAVGSGPLVALLKKPGATVPNPDAPPQNPFPDPNAPPDPDPEPNPEAPDPVPVVIMLDSFTKKHHDKWEIRCTDLLVIMEATVAVPTQGDKLDIDGLDYDIMAVDPLAPGGVALMYECQCRR